MENSLEDLKALMERIVAKATNLVHQILVGESPAINAAKEEGLRYAEMVNRFDQYAPRTAEDKRQKRFRPCKPLLITGETGTGKEIIALWVRDHLNGERQKIWNVQNCGNLTEELARSDLFGHKKGAAANLIDNRDGSFPGSHRGCLFFDEFADLPSSVYVQFNRAIEYGMYERVGEIEKGPVDVVVFAATNRPLQQMIKEGKFPSDLYYRFATHQVVLPPLRERREDIPLLTQYFLMKESRSLGMGEVLLDKIVTPTAMKALVDAPWPGNVRQLAGVAGKLLNDLQYISSSQIELDQVRQALAPFEESPAEPAQASCCETGTKNEYCKPTEENLWSLYEQYVKPGKCTWAEVTQNHFTVGPDAIRKRCKKLGIPTNGPGAPTVPRRRKKKRQ